LGGKTEGGPEKYGDGVAIGGVRDVGIGQAGREETLGMRKRR
jgi:hypothetical protein